MKTMYTSPESEVFFVENETSFMLSNVEDRDMTPLHGDDDTAGDNEGGIGGNDYDL